MVLDSVRETREQATEEMHGGRAGIGGGAGMSEDDEDTEDLHAHSDAEGDVGAC